MAPGSDLAAAPEAQTLNPKTQREVDDYPADRPAVAPGGGNAVAGSPDDPSLNMPMSAPTSPGDGGPMSPSPTCGEFSDIVLLIDPSLCTMDAMMDSKIDVATEGNDAEPLNPEVTTQGKRRRKKSMVWDHFTIEAVAGNCTRACCKLCKQTFAYSNGSKIAGTSHLKRHITLGSCPKIKGRKRKQLSLSTGQNVDADTAEPPKRRYKTSVSSNYFDQEQSSTNLAKMIILHEYPHHIVEQPAFVAFVQSLQPEFRMLDVSSIEDEILSVYQKEKLNLLQNFGTMPGRVSFTIGLWTTSQSLAYISLEGQFIDNDWRLQRRMLNFLMVSSPHSENALSEAITTSLSDWNLKTKLFTITLDNDCSSHDIYSANLRDHLSNKNTLMLKGQLFVVRCYVHILNVLAQEAISSIHDIIYNIRESIKFVKVSPDHEEKFSAIALQLEIPATKILTLDIVTQWDTTYIMLVSALEYKQVFTALEACDENYNEAPSADDWKKVEIVCTYLKLLYDSANVVMGTIDPTANIFFHEACKVQLELINAIANEDSFETDIAKSMYEKFDKYWKDCSLVLSLAVVMDPRFKMKLVEFSFSKIYGADSTRYVKIIDDSIHELFLEYVAQPVSPNPTFVNQGVANHVNGNGITHPATPSTTANGLLDFDKYLSELEDNHSTKSELEQYLEETLVPRIQEFDILDWWKLNQLKYPTLSKMARDILAIPVSMVSTGCSVFNSGSGSRVLDEYRSSLHPHIVQALFCTKDWLQYVPTLALIPTNAIVKQEY